jgi:hypothetical protein
VYLDRVALAILDLDLVAQIGRFIRPAARTRRSASRHNAVRCCATLHFPRGSSAFSTLTVA